MTSDADRRDGGDGLRRGSRAVAAAILLSRVAGLVRERVLAQWLGAGLAADALRAALRIPNLLQNLLGDGVLSAAFVPTYARLRHEGREEEAGRLAAAVAAVLLGLTATLVVLGVVLAGPLTRLLAPGFPPGSEKYELTVQLVRILAPASGLLVLAAWALAVLTAHRRFFRAYVAPVLWNATIVAAGVAAGLRGLAEAEVATAIAVGAVAGAALQLGAQLLAVRRSIGAGRLRLGGLRADASLRRVVSAARGAIAARGVVQISAYLDLVIASLLAAGAVAALGYAQVLHLLPISLFGMSVAAATLPDLATVGAPHADAAAARIRASLRRATAFALPTAVAYVVLGGQFVGLLFQGGAFGPATTRQVAAVLAAYALGLVATIRGRVLQSALHAFDDTRTPARAATVRVVVGTAVGVGLMVLLDAWRLEAGGPTLVGEIGLAPLEERAATESLLRLGAVGLALGASVGAWVETALLSAAVRRRIPLARARGDRAAVLVPAATVLAAALIARWATGLLPVDPRWGAMVAIAVTGLAGTAALVRAGELTLPRSLGSVVSRRAPRRDAAGGSPDGP